MAAPEPLRGYLQVQREYDSRIARILERTAKDIERRLSKLDITRFSEFVRASQLRAVLSEIRRTQAQMFAAIGAQIQGGQAAAAMTAVDDLDKLSRVALSALNKQGAEAVIDSLRETAQAGIRNLYARQSRELSARLYRDGKQSTDHIQTLIEDAITRGASARELAKDVYKFVSPTAPGGASYVASRLARTEINNAFHNQQIAGFQNPWIEAVKWNLSGSHKRPDECNRLATADQYKLGSGNYPAIKVPGKPHPQCLCFLTGVSASPEKFAADVRSGKYDDELRKRYQANLDLLKGTGKPVAAPKPKLTVVKDGPKKATPKKAPAVKKATPAKTAPAKKTAPAVKKAMPAPKPVPRNAQPYHRNLNGIEDIADTIENSRIIKVETLTGGVSAETDLVTFANGKKFVRKSGGDAGAEHASSLVGQSLGLKVPRVYRNHPSEVFMEYVSNGKTAAQLLAEKTATSGGAAARELFESMSKLYQSDQGAKIGLFDILIANGDRNWGNWMISKGGDLIPIDHGHARPVMAGGRALPQIRANGPFAEVIIDDIKFTKADIDWARAKLKAAGPDLIHMGQRKFLDYALAVLDKLEPKVRGKRNILAGG